MRRPSKVVTQGEPARKRQEWAESGECSESLGSVDRIEGRTTCSASPAWDTSSGNTGAAPLQTADYLQREVFRLKQALEVERNSSRRLRIELDRMMNDRTQAPSWSEEMPSLSILGDLWLKEKSTNVLKEEITVADGNQPDFPIIYANEGFVRMTGYSESETLGRNYRFSQSPNREPRYLADFAQSGGALYIFCGDTSVEPGGRVNDLWRLNTTRSSRSSGGGTCAKVTSGG